MQWQTRIALFYVNEKVEINILLQLIVYPVTTNRCREFAE